MRVLGVKDGQKIFAFALRHARFLDQGFDIAVCISKERCDFIHVFIGGEEREIVALSLAGEGGDGFGDVAIGLAAFFIGRFYLVGQ